MIRSARRTVSAAKRFRYRCETLLLRGLAAFLRLFPRRAVQRAGRGLGWLAYYLAPAARRVALENLEIAFGNARPDIARASFQNVGATMAALLWSPRLTPENFRRYIEVDESTVPRGRSVIFATMHYGDWELHGLATGYLGVPVTIVQENMRNEFLAEYFSELRSHSGHKIVSQELAAMRLMRTLRSGGGTALLVDLSTNRRGGGIWLDFFGLPVFSPPAFAALALRTGAAVVPAYSQPLPDGRARLIYAPAISIERTGDLERDVRELSQRCLKFFEDVIRAAPEPWLWAYKRWSPRPTDEQGRYPSYSRPLRKRDKEDEV